MKGAGHKYWGFRRLAHLFLALARRRVDGTWIGSF
jgi:hypothetical protein